LGAWSQIFPACPENGVELLVTGKAGKKLESERRRTDKDFVSEEKRSE
jgi:hypothetical protein